MSLSRRKFTKEFKLAAVRRLETGASIAEVARACEVNPNVLHRWRREFRDGVDRAFPGNGKSKAEQDRVAELERKIGQQTLEIDILKRVLQRVEEARCCKRSRPAHHLRANRERNPAGHADDNRPDVPNSGRQSSKLVPPRGRIAEGRSRRGPAG